MQPARRRRLSSALALLGGMFLMAVPVFLFSAKHSDPTMEVVLLTCVFASLCLGLACFAAAPVMAARSKLPVSWMAMLFLMSAGISLGGVTLALAADATIFIATLVSAMFSFAVVWYGRMLSQLEGKKGKGRSRGRRSS